MQEIHPCGRAATIKFRQGFIDRYLHVDEVADEDFVFRGIGITFQCWDLQILRLEEGFVRHESCGGGGDGDVLYFGDGADEIVIVGKIVEVVRHV